MLSVYFLPCIMRPLDYLANIRHYTCGFVSYILMMPVFTNTFVIYAMCNLHDVSWGNRPTSTGQEAFSASKNVQANSEADYKVYRTNFVLLWILCNALYYVAIDTLGTSDGNHGAQEGDIRAHDTGYLVGFSCYLAALVLFRLLFASLYIIKWKCRYSCCGKYRVRSQNLQAEFKKIKKTDGESTDDEEIEREVRKLYEENRDAIGQDIDKTLLDPQQREKSRRELHDATIDFMAKKDSRAVESDEDYDFREFEDAGVEEAEDRIYRQYKDRQKTGRILEPDELAGLAGNVPIEDMNTSTILSALGGRFEAAQNSRANQHMSTATVDLSAAMMQAGRTKS